MKSYTPMKRDIYKACRFTYETKEDILCYLHTRIYASEFVTNPDRIRFISSLDDRDYTTLYIGDWLVDGPAGLFVTDNQTFSSQMIEKKEGDE